MPPPTRRGRTSRPSADASRPRRGVRCAFPQAARAFWVAVRVLYPLFRNRPKKCDPADNIVPAGPHIFPACIKPPAWPLTCENAIRGHQIGLHGPLSCRGCTRSRRPKNGPKIGTRAAQTAIYGRGRGLYRPGGRQPSSACVCVRGVVGWPPGSSYGLQDDDQDDARPPGAPRTTAARADPAALERQQKTPGTG